MARPKLQSVKPARISAFRNTLPEIVAEWCAISVSTARHFLSGHRRPSPPVRKLYELHREGKILGPEWDGWRIKGNKLLDPHGKHVTPELLEIWELVWQIAASKDPDGYHAILDRMKDRA